MVQSFLERAVPGKQLAGSHHLPSRNPRSDASREELAELAQQANPEEIQLGEEEDEEEMDLEPNGQWPELGRVKSRGGPSLPSLSHPHLDLTFPPQKSNWNSRLCQLLCSGA